MVRTGFVLVAIGVASVSLVLAGGVPVWAAAFSWAVGGLGMGLAYPSLSMVMLNVAPEGEEGTTTSSFKQAELLSAAAAAAIAGAIVAGGESADALRPALLGVFAMAAAAAVAGYFVAVRLPGEDR